MILEVVTLNSTPSTRNLRVRLRVFLLSWWKHKWEKNGSEETEAVMGVLAGFQRTVDLKINKYMQRKDLIEN